MRDSVEQGLSVICVQKVPIRKIREINALRHALGDHREIGGALCVDVMEISKPDGLGDIANLGLTLAEAKQLLAETPGRIVTAQCAGLVLAYSRRLFIQYYPRFTRFEAKTFLLEAVRFMDGVCPVCVIDNTSVLLAAGAGADAVIAPEMLAFARTLGFRFRAHRVGHPDRKGRIERPFAYVENNFLAARDFADFEWARATSSVPSVSRISI